MQMSSSTILSTIVNKVSVVCKKLQQFLESNLRKSRQSTGQPGSWGQKLTYSLWYTSQIT